MSKEAPKKGAQPRLVLLNKASKLAEKWVNEMGGSLEDSKSRELEIEGRPERLGIGATIPRQSKYVPSSDPVERKLRADIEAAKRKKLKNTENSTPSARDATADDDDSDEEESKAESFSKRRPIVLSSLPQGKKSRK
ncbi:hypothetical protein Leryth_011635 [Lithospermum erythrorhizon]|nr:hypothetical protein Leryth_011635 [Lithospermum erythrorhizon]